MAFAKGTRLWAQSLGIVASVFFLGCDPNAVTEPENVPAKCSDNVDNDGDGAIDCNDIECANFANCFCLANPGDPACSTQENCNNGSDDDGDNQIDCNDTDCAGNVACNSAENSAATCDNTIDDDGDGLTDCDDPNCLSFCNGGNNENGALCFDSQDNDNDGLANCADPDCAEECNNQNGNETGLCGDGQDNDTDTLFDCQDPDCFADALCGGSVAAEDCTDCVDNDGNGLVDCDDIGDFGVTSFGCLFDLGCFLGTHTCQANPICGDNAVDAGEQCDGANLGGQSCQSQGFSGGTLACNANCTFDTSGCTAPPNCGDGNVQTNEGEQCDGANLNGQDCTAQGFDGGNLACDGQCRFDTTGCFNNESGDCASPFSAGTNGGTFNNNTVGAPDNNETDFFSNCQIGAGQPEHVYLITAGANGQLSTSLSSPGADMGIYIRIADSVSAAQCLDSVNEVDCVDDLNGNGTETTGPAGVTGGDSFYIFVDGCDPNSFVGCDDGNGGVNTSGPYTLTITLQ